MSPITRVNFAAFFVVQTVLCTFVGVALVGDYKAMCRSSTNAMGRADAALTGLSNGEHTLRTHTSTIHRAALSEVNLKKRRESSSTIRRAALSGVSLKSPGVRKSVPL